MKSAALIKPGQITIEDRTAPKAGRGEVVVKVKACGICGTDLHAYKGGFPVPSGTVMGHELSGEIQETGEGVERLKPGDRVAVHPSAKCLRCHWCLQGRLNLCVNSKTIGLSLDNDGGFAEYVRLPADYTVFPIPENVSFEQAALTEPLATSYHAVRISRFRAGDTALVVGAGPIGLGAIMFLKIAGARRILALEVSARRAEIALKAGADTVFDPVREGDNLAGAIREFSDGIGADTVFDCSGVPHALTNATYHVKRGGQIMIVGVPETESSVHGLLLALSEINIQGCFGSNYPEFAQVIQMLAANMIDTHLMISDLIALEDIEKKGFKRLTESQDAIKIIVTP
jgi:(R,R)-butanediol dehydrogenase/meso-butanediol dehydrogenase/diacetyl reductase